mmetsp:Transcript_2876/g.8786  ORF Transcript_2876/g.8786 Transcript_2876/m.8786 type:complete len:245 (-) Transcript_2876:1553-2287(-)
MESARASPAERLFGFETPKAAEKRGVGVPGKDGIRDSFTQLFTPNLFAVSPSIGGHGAPSPNLFEDYAHVPRSGVPHGFGTPLMGGGFTPMMDGRERESMYHDIHNDYYGRMEDRVVPSANPFPMPTPESISRQVENRAAKAASRKTKASSAAAAAAPKREAKIPSVEATAVPEAARKIDRADDPRKQALMKELQKKTREAAIVRWKQKRRERLSGKHIRYTCRKKLADARPRVKGRFVKTADM